MWNNKVLKVVVLAILSTLFLVGCGNIATLGDPTPVVNDPLQVGDIAPDFTLPDSNGNMIQLAHEYHNNEVVVLVFYRTYL